MEEYISRLKGECRASVLVLWWVMRAAMLAVFVLYHLSDKCTPTGQIHIALCFIGSFLWELSLAMPKKSLFRFMPPSIHTVINIGLTVSAVLGVYFNMYYTVRLFDPLLQAFFSFVSMLYGYEIANAFVKKEHFAATKAMVYFVAFGVSFICFNIWELGEFFADQLVGYLTGNVGNAQFWSVLLSEGTARAESVFPSLVPERQPLMDIMADIVIHSASAFTALIFVNLCPYRLRGKYKYDTDYGNNLVKVKDFLDS